MSAIFKNGTWYGNGGGGGSIDVDADFSTTSENPVQNKTITGALGSLTQLDTTEKTNLVGAVNETLGKGGTKISQAEFDVLSQAEKDNGTAWYIYDGEFENNFMAHTGFTPIGTVISVMGTTAPNHYLACEGQVVSIAAYPELANYFEQQFGTKNYFGGNGTTTFGIPDLRGEFLRGTGTNGHANQGDGASVGTHQDATVNVATPLALSKSSGTNILMAPINESYVSGGSDASYDYYKEANVDKTWGRTRQLNINADRTDATSGNWSGQYTSRPTNTSVLYCIATKNIYIDVNNQYSTDEMVVGTWIDGKPIYQKTVYQASIATGTYVLFDVANVISFSGQGTYRNGNHLVIPYTFGSDYASFYIVGSGDNINKLMFQTNVGPFTNFYCTFQYTKTTD